MDFLVSISSKVLVVLVVDSLVVPGSKRGGEVSRGNRKPSRTPSTKSTTSYRRTSVVRYAKKQIPVVVSFLLERGFV